jgi:hypothetical protein
MRVEGDVIPLDWIWTVVAEGLSASQVVERVPQVPEGLGKGRRLQLLLQLGDDVRPPLAFCALQARLETLSVGPSTIDAVEDPAALGVSL